MKHLVNPLCLGMAFWAGLFMAPSVLWSQDEPPPAPAQDMAVSRIYLEDVQYLPDGLIEVHVGIWVRDKDLQPLRRAMIGIASDRPGKDLFYDSEGKVAEWLRTDYEGRVSFLMKTSVEGSLRVGATVNEAQVLWPLTQYIYGYSQDPQEANLVAGKLLEVTLDRNARLNLEGIAPHEEERMRPFYGAGHVTFYLDSDIMIQDGALLRLDAPPVLANGVAFLPLRAAAQALGATARWDVNFKTAILTRGDWTLRVQSGAMEMVRYMGQDRQPMMIPIDPPAYLDEGAGRVMMPIRAIADAFGAVASYDQNSRSIHLTQQREDSHAAGGS